MAKGNLILNKEWESLFSDLPDEQAGQLIKAAFACHSGEEVEISDPILSAVFGMMASVIKENAEKYERKCKQNAENRKRASTTVNDRQRVAVNKIKENKIKENKDIKEKVSSSEDTKKKSTPRFTPPTIDEVMGYVSEKGYPVDVERFMDYYTSNGWMVGKNHMKDWKATVRNWARSPNNNARSGTVEVSHPQQRSEYDPIIDFGY